MQKTKLFEHVLPTFPQTLPCKIAIIGEAPGFDEAKKGEPFVGRSGKLLNRALADSGIDRSECFIGNVFTSRPEDNEVKEFFMSNAEAKKLGWDKECPFPSMPSTNTQLWVRPEYVSEVTEFKAALAKADPNIVIALGNTALWGISGKGKISMERGIVQQNEDGLKYIATWHPSAVLRMWTLLPVFVKDIRKAKKFSETKDLTYPTREIWINPTLEEVFEFYEQHILPLRGTDISLSFDIETIPKAKLITHIGYAPSDRLAICIPLIKNGQSYWSRGEELKIFKLIASIQADSSIKKVAHNGQYDVQYLERTMSIVTKGRLDDTMIMHHALEPELQKSLGFLTSLYLNQPSWKTLVSFEDKKDG